MFGNGSIILSSDLFTYGLIFYTQGNFPSSNYFLTVRKDITKPVLRYSACINVKTSSLQAFLEFKRELDYKEK